MTFSFIPTICCLPAGPICRLTARLSPALRRVSSLSESCRQTHAGRPPARAAADPRAGIFSVSAPLPSRRRRASAVGALRRASPGRAADKSSSLVTRPKAKRQPRRAALAPTAPAAQLMAHLFSSAPGSKARAPGRGKVGRETRDRLRAL